MNDSHKSVAQAFPLSVARKAVVYEIFQKSLMLTMKGLSRNIFRQQYQRCLIYLSLSECAHLGDACELLGDT